MRTTALLIVLAGCSFPTKPGPPFACVKEPLPMQVTAAVIHVHGNVLDRVHSSAAVVGATVTGWEIPVGGAPVPRFGPDTTGSAGAFGFDEQVMMEAPLKEYIQSRINGYHDTYFYPALSVASDLYVTLLQFDDEGFDGLAAVATGMMSPPMDTPSFAPLIVSVVDCNDQAVGGATVTVTQTSPTSNSNVPVIYLNRGNPDSGRNQTADDGFAAALVPVFVSGSAPYSFRVRATFGEISYHPNDVTVTMGAVTFTEVAP